MYNRPVFVTGQYYHLYNRGVAKQPLFHDDQDYRHFLLTIAHYQEAEPTHRLSDLPPQERAILFLSEAGRPIIEMIAFSLMPNHFHLLVRQLIDGGISTFMRRAMNSYTRAYNVRYHRVGTVFQGRFSAVLVTTDEQLLHLVRYIHLNAVVSHICERPEDYRWSSHRQYLTNKTNRLCHPQLLLTMIGGDQHRYQSFVNDQIAYASELELIKHLTLED
jgi:putative transposase